MRESRGACDQDGPTHTLHQLLHSLGALRVQALRREHNKKRSRAIRARAWLLRQAGGRQAKKQASRQAKKQAA